MKSKTTPPSKKGVSGKKAKKGTYPRTKKHREDMAKKVAKHRAETPPTPAQKEASRENGHLGGGEDEYKPEYLKQLIEYFDKEPTKVVVETHEKKDGTIVTREKVVGVNFPTLETFCRVTRISRMTLHRWADAHPEFGRAVEFAKTCQAEALLVNGMHGNYAQPMAVLFAKTNMGYTERVAIGGDADAPPVEVVLKDEREKRRAACMDKMKQLVARGVLEAAK